MVGLVVDHVFAKHQQEKGCPEDPARTTAIFEAFCESGVLAACRTLPVVAADFTTLTLNHSSEYVRKFQAACAGAKPEIVEHFGEEYVSPTSFETASKAVGSVVNAADLIMRGETQSVFCVIRPPGHHAEKERAKGFCFFNNIAIAAHHLLEQHGLKRILVLDWDVHHGDGTQKSFYSDPRVLCCSLHVDPRFIYPRVSGFANETGQGAGLGMNINIPLRVGDGPTEYIDAFEQVFLPTARSFKPEFVLIAAGFDAHAEDPLGKLKLRENTFRWLTRKMVSFAQEYSQGRLLSVLEGGYNLQALGECANAHLEELISCEDLRPNEIK